MTGKVTIFAIFKFLYVSYVTNYVFTVKLQFLSPKKESFEQAIAVAAVSTETLEKVLKM